MKFIVRVIDSGPLSFRSGRDTNNNSTLPYISGSTLMGVLASMYARQRNSTDELTKIFLSQSTRFSNLYPARFEGKDPKFQQYLHGNRDPVHPIPVTAATCKRFQGFLFDQDEDKDEHHGVYDTLIPWGLFALSRYSTEKMLTDVKDCNCGEPMDRFSGFYRQNSTYRDKLGNSLILPGLRTRTGINRKTGTAQSGILYSREILQAGMTFWGTSVIPDDYANLFKDFVEDLSEQDLIRLGNNRTRGFGRVRLQISRSMEEDSLATLGTRIQTFDEALRTKAQKYGIPTPHKFYVPITLTSDAILFDNLLRYRTSLDDDYLQQLSIDGAELIYQNSGTRTVMGWNALLKVPKADDVAIKMGSVFLFGVSTELNEQTLQNLLGIQKNGIGARRNEGFGQLQVAHPFHWEVKERWQEQ